MTCLVDNGPQGSTGVHRPPLPKKQTGTVYGDSLSDLHVCPDREPLFLQAGVDRVLTSTPETPEAQPAFADLKKEVRTMRLINRLTGSRWRHLEHRTTALEHRLVVTQ